VSTCPQFKLFLANRQVLNLYGESRLSLIPILEF
jgi:hypothetical protein